MVGESATAGVWETEAALGPPSYPAAAEPF